MNTQVANEVHTARKADGTRVVPHLPMGPSDVDPGRCARCDVDTSAPYAYGVDCDLVDWDGGVLTVTLAHVWQSTSADGASAECLTCGAVLTYGMDYVSARCGAAIGMVWE